MSDINTNATLTFTNPSTHPSSTTIANDLLLTYVCNVNICCFITCVECCVFQNFVQCYLRLVYHFISSHRLTLAAASRTMKQVQLHTCTGAHKLLMIITSDVTQMGRSCDPVSNPVCVV